MVSQIFTGTPTPESDISEFGKKHEAIILKNGTIAFCSDMPQEELEKECKALYPKLDVSIISHPQGLSHLPGVGSSMPQCDFERLIKWETSIGDELLPSKPDVVKILDELERNLSKLESHVSFSDIMKESLD